MSQEDETEESGNGDEKDTYQKRAQHAEKKITELESELASVKTHAEGLESQLQEVKAESTLIQKLTHAGAGDLEAAVMMTRARMKENPEADVDGVIEQLKQEKHYLFEHGLVASGQKTAGARERNGRGGGTLERAAKLAATSGNRTHVQEYMRVRRNIKI